MSGIDGASAEELAELADALPSGLELWEVLREPRFAPASDRQRQTTLDASGLREELSCAICFGIIQRCVVIMACLHRFCAQCVEKAMRIGSSECPKCRRKIPSRRYLRPDPIYDSIISRLISNVKVFEEMSNVFVMAFNKGIQDDPTLEQIRQTILAGRAKGNVSELASIDSVVCPNGFSAASAFDEKQYIREMKARRRELRAALPPPPDDLKTRYRLVAVDGLPQISPDEILEDGRVTLHHLAMYLKVRLGLPLQSDFVFYAEMPQWAAERGVRRRWVVGESDQTLPHMRTEALHHSHETLTVYYGAQEPLEDHEEGPGPEERPEAAS